MANKKLVEHNLVRQESMISASQSLILRRKAQIHATTLSHRAALDVDGEPEHIRKTSIICTIGPKTQTVESLIKLRKAGMNIVRMNFSHGSFEFHKATIDNTRETFKTFPGRSVAIALDTKGPEIRTGLNKDDAEINLEAGSQVVVTVDDAFKSSSTKEKIYVDYKNMTKVLSPGKKIYIDDGLISLEVISIGETDIVTKVVNSGTIGSRKGVNLPGTKVDLPALSDFDKEALKFGVENGIDMIFASFIRKRSDVLSIREVLGEKGKDILIISKIENQEGIRNFPSILEVSDGIMVARGDLGIEIPPAKVFIAQKMMISQCNLVGKPAICATQMLESMTTNPRPTRAEVSDVANAVLDGADCVMLSGETAKGKYPIETVEMMHSICLEAESAINYNAVYNEMRLMTSPSNIGESLACAAVTAALETDVGAIIVLTTTGTTARLVSKYRPRCPIITVTRSDHTARVSHLYRGCYPLVYTTPEQNDENWQDDVDERILWAMDASKTMGLISSGMTVVAIQGWKRGIGFTNTMRMLIVPE